MGDSGDNYFQTLTQFVTTLISRRNCLIDLVPKIGKSSDFLSILYGKPLREFSKLKFKIGDRIRISKYDLLFWRDYKTVYTGSCKLLPLLPENVQNTIKDEIIRGKFYQKELIKLI